MSFNKQKINGIKLETEKILEQRLKNNEETVMESIKNSKLNTGETKKTIRNLEQQTLEEEEEMQYDYREGQTFVDSMISEYGEDVFPDR